MKKSLNCIAMKDQIQARLNGEFKGLSYEGRRAAIYAALHRSRSPIGRLWRELLDRNRAKSSPAKVAETGVEYGAVRNRTGRAERR